MAHLTRIEIINWAALYTATALCCAIAMALSVSVLAYELYRERSWEQVRSISAAVLYLLKTWWRWQKLYLLSTPVTLGIVGSFSLTLSWG